MCTSVHQVPLNAGKCSRQVLYTKVDMERLIYDAVFVRFPCHYLYSVSLPPLVSPGLLPFRLRMRGRHTEDLAPLLPPQLSTNYTVDAGANGVTGLADEDAGVVVKLDDAAVGALHLLARAHDDGVSDVTALHLVRRRGGTHTGIGCAARLLDNGYEAVSFRRRKTMLVPILSLSFSLPLDACFVGMQRGML